MEVRYMEDGYAKGKINKEKGGDGKGSDRKWDKNFSNRQIRTGELFSIKRTSALQPVFLGAHPASRTQMGGILVNFTYPTKKRNSHVIWG